MQSGQSEMLRWHSQTIQRQQSRLSAVGRNSAFATHSSQPVIRRASVSRGVRHDFQFPEGRCLKLAFEPCQLFQHFCDLPSAGCRMRLYPTHQLLTVRQLNTNAVIPSVVLWFSSPEMAIHINAATECTAFVHLNLCAVRALYRFFACLRHQTGSKCR